MPDTTKDVLLMGEADAMGQMTGTTQVADEGQVEAPVADEGQVEAPVADEGQVEAPVADEGQVEAPVADEGQVEIQPQVQDEVLFLSVNMMGSRLLEQVMANAVKVFQETDDYECAEVAVGAGVFFTCELLDTVMEKAYCIFQETDDDEVVEVAVDAAIQFATATTYGE